MQFSLLLHYPELTPEEIPDDVMQETQAAFGAYARSLDDAGVLVGHPDVLQPSTASTTVTRKNGSVEVQDGPFADTRDQLAGIFVISVPDLDAALGWAEKCPAAQFGTVEVRPSAITYRDRQWSPPQ